MKLATKNMAQEIADEMSTANHGVNIKKKMKNRIFEIAKKIAKKVARNNKKELKATAKIVVNASDNHLPAAKPLPQNNTKPQGLKK